MNTIRTIILCFSFLQLFTLTVNGVPADYQMVWHDEFDTGTTPELGSIKRHDGWIYSYGGGGWGNGELQYYVKGNESPENCFIKDGILHIVLTKDVDSLGNVRYHSIRMRTGGNWKYGYFEASIKLPSGSGTWPAFWMMPATGGWPDDGEIDIMEAVGNTPGYVYSTVHSKKYKSGIARSFELPTSQDGFHKYAVEWTSSYLRFYVDDIMFYQVAANQDYNVYPFNDAGAFYIILNLAFGGSWGGAAGVNLDCLPQTMEVDYVRVYQPNVSGIQHVVRQQEHNDVYSLAGYKLPKKTKGINIINGKKILIK